MSAWKPGDVAAVALMGGEQVVAVRNARNDGWSHAGEFGGGSAYDNIGAHEARPLVVIDPEDREQVERLVRAFWAASDDQGSDVGDMQAALRSLTANPKPDEPQSLGAVVEDAMGDQWVLIHVAGEDVKPTRQWRTWWGHRPYADIDVVRVLGEGVTQ